MAEQLLQAVQIHTGCFITGPWATHCRQFLSSGHFVVKLVEHNLRLAFSALLIVLAHGRLVGICLGMLVMAVLCLQTANGEELDSGSSSRKHRQEAVDRIPFERLNQQTKLKISGVLEKTSMYRSLPKMAIQVDPEYLQFLIRHPEVVVNIWELMGITDMTAERVGPYKLRTNDGAGTTSDMELVYGSNDLHIFYGQGQYEGPVLRKKLDAQFVIVVKTTPRANPPIALNPNQVIVPNDRQVVCQLDVFIRIQNATAGLIVRTVQPIVGPTADHNFVESMTFVQRLNETTENNGYGVQQMGKKLSVDRSVQDQFIKIAGEVHQRALAREINGQYDASSDRNAGSPINAPAGVQQQAQPNSNRYDVKQSSYSGHSGLAARNGAVQRAHHYSGYSNPPRSFYRQPVPVINRSNNVQHAVFSDRR